MDRVTEVTVSWFGEARRYLEREHGAGVSFGPDTQSWLTNVVMRGFEAAVSDVVEPGRAEVVLETVMREAPDEAEVQVTPETDLPQAVVEHLAPQFGALADRGLDVNTTLLTTALSERIAAAVESDIDRDYSRRPVADLLGGLPGFPFTPSRGDEDDDDDDNALTGR